MLLMVYQVIGILISLFALFLITEQFKQDNISTRTYLVWTTLWVLIILLAIFPKLTAPIAKLVGIGRGLDLAFIIAIMISFYIMFKLYNQINDQKRRIDELVSQLAVEQEENRK